jgi:hypothetical protein
LPAASAELESPVAVEVAGGNPLAESASRQIEGEYMRGIIKEISDDRYEGRGPGSRGDEAARKYLVERMVELGLDPGAEDGGWEQPFDLVGVNATQPETWTFAGHDRSMTLKQWDQFIAGSGVQEDRAEISEAEVVFVGYGIQSPEYDWDDYKGVDLNGKVLLMMNNDPDWDPDLFAGETRLWYGRWDYKYLSAARQGAAGAIIIHTSPSAGYPFQVVQNNRRVRTRSCCYGGSEPRGAARGGLQPGFRASTLGNYNLYRDGHRYRSRAVGKHPGTHPGQRPRSQG